MQDGIYAISFSTPLGEGTGVAFLRGGVLEGGDAAVFYKGNYTLDGSNFKATVKTGTHSHPPGQFNVMGRDSVTLTLQGSFDGGNNATAQGTAPEAPGVNIAVKMKRVAD